MTEPNLPPDPLAALREAEAQRTPGEWEARPEAWASHLLHEDDGEQEPFALLQFTGYRGPEQVAADRAFIAAVTRHLPALLAEVERLRAEREKLRDEIIALKGELDEATLQKMTRDCDDWKGR